MLLPVPTSDKRVPKELGLGTIQCYVKHLGVPDLPEICDQVLQMFWQSATRPKLTYDSSGTPPVPLELPTALPITLSEAQSKSLDILKRLEHATGHAFILVDTYSTAKLRFWHLLQPGSDILQDRIKIVTALAREDVIVTVQFRSKRMKPMRGMAKTVLMKLSVEAIGSIGTVQLYPNLLRKKPNSYDSRSSVEIEFIEPGLDGSYSSKEYSFVQTSLTPEETRTLSFTTLLGHEFKAVRSLISYRSLDTIPDEIDLVMLDFDSRVANSNPAFKQCRLHMSVMSALTHLRGVRRILIATETEVPSNLVELDSRIVPIACSNLEDAIHTVIPNDRTISRRFLWLREGLFFRRPMTPFDFFDEYGRTRYFPSSRNTIDDDIDPASEALREMLLHRFGPFVTRKFKYVPIAMEKAVLDSMHSDLGEHIKQLDLRNPLPDLSFEDLYCHYAAATGHAVEGDIAYSYLNVNTKTFQARLRRLARDIDCDVFCIRGFTASEFTPRNEEYCLSKLPSLFQ